YPRLHAQAVDAEERAEREREAAFLPHLDDDAVSAVPDFEVLEQPLVTGHGKARLGSVYGLDIDVAARDGDLERYGEGSWERLLEHRQTSPRCSARLTRSLISLARGSGRRSGRSSRPVLYGR